MCRVQAVNISAWPDQEELGLVQKAAWMLMVQMKVVETSRGHISGLGRRQDVSRD